MPNTNGAIPLRQFGRHEVKISAVGFGGHHLGDAPDEGTAVRLVRQAVDGGITFFDNCWEYHRGKSEAWMGAGLKGVRDRLLEGVAVSTLCDELSLKPTVFYRWQKEFFENGVAAFGHRRPSGQAGEQ